MSASSSLAMAVAATLFVLAAVAACPNRCGNTTVPYPFYIKQHLHQRQDNCSSGHKRRPFGLLCDASATLRLEIQSKRYKVLNFTAHSNVVIIDPSSSSSTTSSTWPSNSTCSHHSTSSFSLGDSSSNSSYALSYDNFIALYNCSNQKTCPNNCVNSRTSQWLGRTGSAGCDEPDCCYDMQFASSRMLRDFDISALGCQAFSSWVITFNERDSQVVWDASYGLGLEWSLDGTCSPSRAASSSSSSSSSSSRKIFGNNRKAAAASSLCAENAHCVNGTLQGHICACDNQHEGDPYLEGCTPAGQALLNKHQKSQKIWKPIMFAGILAGATVIAALVIAFAIVKRRKLQQRFLPDNPRACVRDAKQLSKFLTRCGSCNKATLFSYKELEKATKGFAASQMLGHGGHGTVYAGKLADGREVAVKRINHMSTRGMEQVINEVKVLLSVNHPNLVQLLGCCLEVYDPLLVYEYVPNGTLAEHLQGKRGDGLDWYARITIAVEAAQALAYLHTAVNPPVYHRDVKSTNILLDFDLNTKVADFGLSKLVLTEDSHISTAPQGTPGYLDPEYHQNFQLSDKSDVYSFGVVLVEMITALKVVDFARDKREVNLAALAVGKIANDKLDDIIDPVLQANKNPVVRCMVQRVAELAFRCLAYEKEARPSMLEVVEELESIKGSCLTPLGANSPIRNIKIDESLLPR